MYVPGWPPNTPLSLWLGWASNPVLLLFDAFCADLNVRGRR